MGYGNVINGKPQTQQPVETDPEVLRDLAESLQDVGEVLLNKLSNNKKPKTPLGRLFQRRRESFVKSQVREIRRVAQAMAKQNCPHNFMVEIDNLDHEWVWCKDTRNHHGMHQAEAQVGTYKVSYQWYGPDEEDE